LRLGKRIEVSKGGQPGLIKEGVIGKGGPKEIQRLKYKFGDWVSGDIVIKIITLFRDNADAKGRLGGVFYRKTLDTGREKGK